MAKRRLISTLLIIMICFVASFAVQASDTESIDGSEYNTYEGFCDDYYSNHEKYIVHGKNGGDISEAYYGATINLYKEENYTAIIEYMLENVHSFEIIKKVDGISTFGVIQRAEREEIFYETITNDRLTDCLMGYKISGAFTYNANTGKIATAYSPSVSIFYTEVNGVYSYSMEDVSTSAKITSDGYSVIATAKFYVRTTLGAPIIEDISLPFSERSGPYGDSTYPWSGI